MFRLLKALPAALALAALGIFAASCGSSGSVQIRFVNAIQDTAQYGTAFDVNINGAKKFSAVAFQGFQPPSGYTTVAAGGTQSKGFK